MGERGTEGAKEKQRFQRQCLGISRSSDPVILVMGGGEGVGSLEEIVEDTVGEMMRTGTNGTVAVVCGRNDILRNKLAGRDWEKNPPIPPSSTPHRIRKRHR